MELPRQEQIVVKVAKELAEKQINLTTVQNVVSLICQEYGFEYSLFYEAERHRSHMHLVSSFNVNAQALYEEEISIPELNGFFESDSVMFCCHEHGEITQEQITLLSLFKAESAVVTFLLDETKKPYGCIALCNMQNKEQVDKQACDNLRVMLSLIARSYMVHTYQNWLKLSQTALEDVLDNTGIDIYVNDFYTHDILYVNESMAQPYGGKVEFAGRKCWQVLFPGQTGPCEFCPQENLLDEQGNPTKVYTWDYQRAFDGSWFRVFSAAFQWADGRLAHVVSSADITDNKKSEEMVRYMANYDVLTGLPNRRKLVSDCELRIHSGLEDQTYLLFFDIDGFKNINDTLGHDAGDEFLVKLGEFFSNIPMLKNSIYRNGGDEFVAILGEGITTEHVRDLSRFIHIRFKKPWELKNGKVMCGTSIGVAQYPNDGHTAEDLLRKADQAMYKVKKQGGGGVIFAGEA